MFKKIFQSDIANWLVLLTLFVQVILLGTLTQKISHLEELLFATPTPEIVDRIPDEQGHTLGAANAPITVVEFADFQCPYCSAAESVVKRITSQYSGKVKFIYRHFPLSGIHSYAVQAANAGECANDQGKFWEMHDQIYGSQSGFEKGSFSSQEFFSEIAVKIGINATEFESCMSNLSFNDYVTQDISDGLKYGITGTPTFFVNREKVVGVQNLEATILREIGELSK